LPSDPNHSDPPAPKHLRPSQSYPFQIYQLSQP
jgi:hypothetical protein